jgi:uncharacterized protein (TIGR03437 family)
VDYTYKNQTNDTFDIVVDGLVNLINAGSGDPNVYAAPDHATQTVLLAARAFGAPGNNVAYAATVAGVNTSTAPTITAAAASANLTGGGDASQVGAGTLVSVMGTNLSAGTASADMSQTQLPTSLGGSEVYFNGVRAPLLYVSPTQINAQIPWEVADDLAPCTNVQITANCTSINAYVRSVMGDGSIMVTTPVGATIVPQNPGVFQQGSTANPPPGVVMHGSSQATGVILVDGTIQAGDAVTVTIETRTYTYTIQSGDTLQSVRDALVLLINQDPKVSAIPGYAFAVNLIIKARVAGPEGNGIAYSTSVAGAPGTSGASLILTPETTGLCCANIANTPVTANNPATPGEVLYVYATGLGRPVLSETNQNLIQTGGKYPAGGPATLPVNFVSSLAGGKTANVLQATLLPGSVGVFLVTLQLNSDMPTDPLTNVYIAQDVYISNIVTFPVVNPGQ